MRKWLLLLAGVSIFTAYSIRDASADSRFESEISRLSTLLELKPAMAVADVGAGKGQATVIMARTVGPHGHVFSSEIDTKRLDDIRQAVRKVQLQNVTVVNAGEGDTGLPEDCCQAIFLRGVYHHITQPAAINKSLFRALRPGGLLALIDFPPTWWLRPWKPSGLPENRGGHGIPQNILIGEVTSAGFELVKSIDRWSGRSYCALFRKKAN